MAARRRSHAGSRRVCATAHPDPGRSPRWPTAAPCPQARAGRDVRCRCQHLSSCCGRKGPAVRFDGPRGAITAPRAVRHHRTTRVRTRPSCDGSTRRDVVAVPNGSRSPETTAAAGRQRPVREDAPLPLTAIRVQDARGPRLQGPRAARDATVTAGPHRAPARGGATRGGAHAPLRDHGVDARPPG